MIAILQRWARSGAAPPLTAAPLVTSAARTHVGRVRTVNEDRLLDRPDRALWAVADGMGGHSAGAAAATMAIEALDRIAAAPDPITRATLMQAIAHANATIHAASDAATGTSGATIVAMTLDGLTAMICWAGDSRAYRIRGGTAEPLTHDHSLVQEMIDAGVLTARAAERHPHANVVTRALGVAAGVDIDVTTAMLAPGDRILLCSDGISRSLDARDFTMMPAEIGQCADRLLNNALQRDGSDNATLVVVDIATMNAG